MKKCPIILAVSLASLHIACVHSGRVHGSQIDLQTTIKIQAGSIAGLSLGKGRDVKAYLGIPFAAPPVGDRRWKPPEEVEPWTGVRPCVAYGPSCAQADLSQHVARPLAGKNSEDCLYLNVWTPANRANAPLPVMVWIHGGGFIGGSGSAEESRGESLARKGVVVVTFNYRLGPFGFFAHPLLSAESGHNVSGNYGLLDQIAALRWIRENISNFGGDPERVTIFGASAGGVSVCYLLISPLARGLFQRAIAESAIIARPTLHLREAAYGHASLEKEGEMIAHALNCDREPDPLAALRARRTDEILAISDPGKRLFVGSGNRFSPAVDGWVVPGDLLTTFAEGTQLSVPLIIGTDADEGSLTFVLRAQATSVEDYKSEVRNWFPEDAEEVLRIYPVSGPADGRSALSRIQTDCAFAAPARSIAKSVSDTGPKAGAYLYHFTRVRPTEDGLRFGAFHGSEIPFVFCNLTLKADMVDELDRDLSTSMSAYWISFAASGNPNRDGLAEWPPYDDARRRYLEIGDTIQAKSNLKAEACDLFDRVARHQRYSKPGENDPPRISVRRR